MQEITASRHGIEMKPPTLNVDQK